MPGSRPHQANAARPWSSGGRRPTTPPDVPRVAELEQELEATRTELQGATSNLEISSEEQRAINEEALSVDEEFQATNEELLTSKEELQSLNEELTALNGQLRETLEREHTTYNELKNVLYSTEVATLFLDTNLNIRFFTPATELLFSVIPSDVGRPLADLSSLVADDALLADAQTVLQTLAPLEREIGAQSGAWYIRRILPYRTQDNGVEGVVITFTDITERRRVADALETAKRQAQLANLAKSRLLAAASHDLRQPLQALSLMREILAKRLKQRKDEEALKLVAKLNETADAMSGMLNRLLDIDQIEAGTFRVELVNFPINDLLDRLRGEFAYHAQAQRLALRGVSCGLSIHSDPGLLEEMIRNLLSNALKYTKRGKVLLGCRRRKGMLSIEIWDTGVGIPDEETQTIFEEYYQLDNAAREGSRGLGLGLSIVQRLGILLGHRVRVRSHLGKGSVFAIEIMLPPSGTEPQFEQHRHGRDDPPISQSAVRSRTPHPVEAASSPVPPVIFVVDDDSHVREGIRRVLEEDGRTVEDYESCEAFLEAYRPGCEACLLIDAYLPRMNGLELLQRLSDASHRLPAIMITGNSDVPMAVQAMKAGASDFIEKPISRSELLASVERALERSRDSNKLLAWRETAANHIADLTPRQRQIMELVLAGHPSKNIAADLGISQRTVENHRAAIMKKTGSKSLPALARLALAATWNGANRTRRDSASGTAG
jgi:two-component system, chemotaxis family, CheB/CheR fusion protein